jgi:hypothetical protein
MVGSTIHILPFKSEKDYVVVRKTKKREPGNQRSGNIDPLTDIRYRYPAGKAGT